MRIIKFHLVLLLAFSSLIFSQEIKVKQITQITDLSKGEFYYPKLSPDGSKIFFTSSNYQGLWYYDLTSNTVSGITDKEGAGYGFVFSADSKNVIYRSHKYEGMKKYYSLFEQDITTSETKTLEADKGDLYPPQLTGSNQITCAYNKGLNSYNLESGKNELQKNVSKPVVIIDDQKIVLFINGEKKILAPLGEGNYIWPSISPDNKKLVFTFAGHGTYVSDLDGNIISNLGRANAPQWSPDSKWIMYMADKDDGSKVISSEIYITNIDGTNKVQITNTADIHEMYPVWSPDGKKAAFNSFDGKIYLAELNID